MVLPSLRTILFFYVVAVSASLFANDTVSLEIDAPQTSRDQHGAINYTVTAGQPFTINVKINGQAQGNVDFNAPEHTSLHHFGTQRSFSSMNGAMSCTVIHNYQATVEKEGQVLFGPVKVTIDGKVYESQAVHVNVIKEQGTNEKHNKASTSTLKEKDIFCRVTSDKKHAVIGEPIIVTLSIYLHSQVNQVGLEPYHFDGFLVKELPEKQPRREVVDGKTYIVMEKQFLLHPTDEGTKKIKPFTVIYERLVPDESAAQNFFGIAMFGGMRVQRGKVSSSPLEIIVTKLPGTKQAINGVGHFTQFTASVDKQEAVANEPILLRLAVKGTAHFDQVSFDHPTLPSFCTFYSSKSATTYDDQQQLTGTKNFEFIIQIGQAGSIELPAQTFTFFDIHKHAYQTLTTKPLTITIKPSPDSQVSQPPVKEISEPQTADVEKETKEQNEPVIKDIHFIYEDFGQERPIAALPGWFFSALLLVSLMLWTLQSQLPKKYSALFAPFFSKRSHEKKLLHIKKKIETALHEHNVLGLHQLFIVFICTRLNLQQEDFSEQMLAQILVENGWHQNKVAELLDFLNTCASLRFSAGKTQQKHLDDVVEQAKKWLSFLVEN